MSFVIMTIKIITVDKSSVITTIGNVKTVDMSYVLMTIGNVTVDNSDVIPTIGNVTVDKT